MSRLTTKQRRSRQRRRVSYTEERAFARARREEIAQAAIDALWKTNPWLAPAAGPYLDARLMALFLE